LFSACCKRCCPGRALIRLQGRTLAQSEVPKNAAARISSPGGRVFDRHSTHIHDLATAAVVADGLAPSTRTANTNGPTVDLLAGDGSCFAVQQVGTVSGTSPSLAGRIEQSADGTSWSAISGATFAAVTESDDLQVIRFTRTARYVRWAADITGTSPSFTLGVLIGQQKKTL
jgi:hypothetical protein